MHNSQGFVAQFIVIEMSQFKYIVEQYEKQRINSSVVMNGSKIILLEILHAKFIDSLYYFHMPLSSLPKAYGLHEIVKGIFPHLFNTSKSDIRGALTIFGLLFTRLYEQQGKTMFFGMVQEVDITWIHIRFSTRN